MISSACRAPESATFTTTSARVGCFGSAAACAAAAASEAALICSSIALRRASSAATSTSAALPAGSGVVSDADAGGATDAACSPICELITAAPCSGVYSLMSYSSLDDACGDNLAPCPRRGGGQRHMVGVGGGRRGRK